MAFAVFTSVTGGCDTLTPTAIVVFLYVIFRLLSPSAEGKVFPNITITQSGIGCLIKCLRGILTGCNHPSGTQDRLQKFLLGLIVTFLFGFLTSLVYGLLNRILIPHELMGPV